MSVLFRMPRDALLLFIQQRELFSNSWTLKMCRLHMNAALNWITGLSTVSYVMLWWKDLSISVAAAAAVMPDLLFMFLSVPFHKEQIWVFCSVHYIISSFKFSIFQLSTVPPLCNDAIYPKVSCFLIFFCLKRWSSWNKLVNSRSLDAIKWSDSRKGLGIMTFYMKLKLMWFHWMRLDHIHYSNHIRSPTAFRLLRPKGSEAALTTLI